MITVSIIGTGNVAWHLAKCLSAKAGIHLKQIIGRNGDTLAQFSEFAPCTADISSQQIVDVLIIAVSDTAIAQIPKQIKDGHQLVVHTSGSMPMNALEPLVNRGVFYPLQTFSKGFAVDWSNIPLCLEVFQEEHQVLLLKLASAIGNEVHFINSKEREKLHLAAVFVNNFGNHLLAYAEKICEEGNLDFSLLQPLAEETVKKAFVLGSENAQTGPAKRGDTISLKKHLTLLKDKDQINTYKELTNYILKKYGRKEL
ncbi:MAG: DUF2520 domain-containing protein [Leeuwenhoekiella sp.]